MTDNGAGGDGSYFYSLKTHSVVTAENGGRAADRLGPFATREEAEQALERVRQRNEAADARDEEEEN